MWKRTKTYLIFVSLGLNLAFVGVWVAHAWAAHAVDEREPESAIWCPLHRSLEVTPQQWAEIEPRLKEFQVKVGGLSERTDEMRSEVIDLIAAEEPDWDEIQEKQAEILTNKRQIQRLVVEHLLAEKETLNPEQELKLFTMLRNRTGCSANPPMSGRQRGGLGRMLQNRKASPPSGADQEPGPSTQEAR